MKKTFFLLTLICIIFVPNVSSCNSENLETLNKTTDKPSIVKIREFNGSLTSNHQSRGIGWAGWLSVIISDASGAYQGAKIGGGIGKFLGIKGAAVGAAIGGVVCGAATSLSQYKMSRAISEWSPFSYSPSDTSQISKDYFEASFVITKYTVTEPEFLFGTSLGLDSCSINVGAQHNHILDQIEYIEPEDIQVSIADLDTIEDIVIHAPEYNDIYNQITSNPESQELYTDSDCDQIMIQFIYAIQNTCLTEYDLNYIINFYTTIVKDATDLSDDEKSWLLAGFSVAAFSYRYWTEKWPFVNPQSR